MSYALTNLSGFGVMPSAGGVETLVDRTLGTNIGNATSNGGLAASFDGTTNQGFSVSSVAVGAIGWVGKTHSAAKVCKKVLVYGSNDAGYSSANASCTITLYGKNGGAPSTSTDGTSIGSITFTDTSNESASREIVSTDQVTSFTHWWVEVSSTANIIITELTMYELA
jgi:hypothetical protein